MATPSFFLSFFNRLRKLAGVDLDMVQYHLFIELFLKGHAKDKASLLHLCETLWLTQSRYRSLFQQWFEEAYTELEAQWLSSTPNTPKRQPLPLPQSPIQSAEKAAETKEQTETKTGNETSDSDTMERTSPLHELTLQVEEKPGKMGYPQSTILPKLSEKAFIYTDTKNQPIPRRRLGRLIQRLRLSQVKVATDRLDIPAMVRQLSEENVLHQLIYEQRYKNHQEVILLMDHLGTMSTFQAWGDQLYEALREEIGINSVRRYYFHQYPNKVRHSPNKHFYFFFSNPHQTQAQSFHRILAQCQTKSTLLIIFSDGGIYETDERSPRLRVWASVLSIARREVKEVVWFNPFPAYRWEDRVPEDLSYLVRMFPYDQVGLTQAINQANHAH